MLQHLTNNLEHENSFGVRERDDRKTDRQMTDKLTERQAYRQADRKMDRPQAVKYLLKKHLNEIDFVCVCECGETLALVTFRTHFSFTSLQAVF